MSTINDFLKKIELVKTTTFTLPVSLEAFASVLKNSLDNALHIFQFSKKPYKGEVDAHTFSISLNRTATVNNIMIFVQAKGVFAEKEGMLHVVTEFSLKKRFLLLFGGMLFPFFFMFLTLFSQIPLAELGFVVLIPIIFPLALMFIFYKHSVACINKFAYEFERDVFYQISKSTTHAKD